MTIPTGQKVQFASLGDETSDDDTLSSLSNYDSDPDRLDEDSEKKPAQKGVFVGIQPPNLAFPLSQYSGWKPPLPIAEEEDAVKNILGISSTKEGTYDDDDFVSIVLDDFTVYRNGTYHGNEIVSLSEVPNRPGATTFYFDGTLRKAVAGDRFLKAVPFQVVSIGGYEDTTQHTVGLNIWIQSVYGEKQKFWYHPLNPAGVYKPYHKTFVWLADLGKHVVDFLSLHEKVKLSDFRIDFSSWLRKVHGGNTSFETWFSKYANPDFRHAIIAHAEYLFRQAINLDSKYARHQLWSEIGVTESIIARQPERVKKTVVTQYVYDCFKDMEWGAHLLPIEPSQAVHLEHRKRVQKLGFNSARSKFSIDQDPMDLPRTFVLKNSREIKPGDVIAVRQDEASVWKSGDPKTLWYAFVQRICKDRNNRVWLYVIWLYHPADTVCANMVYPHSNELFFSDHCNCGDQKIENTEVVEVPRVSFFTSQVGRADFFIRQIYRTDEEVFVTLNHEDLYCDHRKRPTMSPVFSPGDTVLADFMNRLEPVEILCQRDRMLEVRTLLRRARDFHDPRCRPNELVYTEGTKNIHVDQVHRRCHIRFYTESERDSGLIPPPYCRDGNGDAFFITCLQDRRDKSSLKPIDKFSSLMSLNQGFEPSDAGRKLRALNLFSGGGNFDRGLEEGNAIRNQWAIDWENSAILTYLANCKNPENVNLYLGSVNDFLYRSMQGQGGKAPRIGEVEFISAGSPCQGYTAANRYKSSENSLRNCSMIASVASFIDHFRPEYAILENVTTMAKKSTKNPLSQMLCALVGMGYQARILNLDAWSFGSAQSRSRLFVFVAAPGLKLPEHPPLTHSHPPQIKNRSLGEAANGLPFGSRRWETPIYDYITASEATRDLPKLGTTKTICVSKPDHRISRFSNDQALINSIPRFPDGQGLKDAIQRGYASPQQEHAFSEKAIHLKSKTEFSWSRVYPNGLIPTITTAVRPQCAFTGRALHWEEQRLLTVMEARRAQGFPDHEVLIGKPTTQWKIVGNSVARQVALALGLSLREACLSNQPSHTKQATNILPTKVNETRNSSGTLTGALETRKSVLIDNNNKPNRKAKEPQNVPGKDRKGITGNRPSTRSRQRHIILSEMSMEETVRKKCTTTATKHSLEVDELILSDDSTCSSCTIDFSEHEWDESVETRFMRQMTKQPGEANTACTRTRTTIRSLTSQKRKRRWMIIDSDDELA